MNTLTCVYCGTHYPEGTPPHGSQVLTDHIKVCEKHPLRKAESDIAMLRSAAMALIGAATVDELAAIEAAIRLTPGVDQDKITALNLIHAIQATA